jgi:hypothetical protein
MILISVDGPRRIVAGIWSVAKPGDAPLGPYFASASILDA